LRNSVGRWCDLLLLFHLIGLNTVSIFLILTIILGNLFRLGIFSPMLFELSEARDMILILIALEGDMAVDTDEGGGSAPSEGVLFSLLLLESGVTVRADEGYHLLKDYKANDYNLKP
jgi:hypothetical protein